MSGQASDQDSQASGQDAQNTKKGICDGFHPCEKNPEVILEKREEKRDYK